MDSTDAAHAALGAAAGLNPADDGSSRWIGWRLRLLVGAALLGCGAVFLLAQWLAGLPELEAGWKPEPTGALRLVSTAEPALRPFVGRVLQTVGAERASAPVAFTDAALLQRSPRWLVDDAQRARQLELSGQLAGVLDAARAAAMPALLLRFDDADLANPANPANPVSVPLKPRGLAALGSMFWLLAALALVLYLVTMAVLLAKPSPRHLPYAVMSLCQSASLLCIAVESVPALALPAAYARDAWSWRTALDLISGAAIVHAAAVHPLKLPGWRAIVSCGWLAAALQIALGHHDQWPDIWWWTQFATSAFGLSAIALMNWSHRLQPHPLPLVLQRFALFGIGGWALLTVAMAAAPPPLQQRVASTGPVIWYVFLASLLLMLPYLSKSQQLLREFSLLALISTVATVLDLAFVALFAFGPFASLTLSLFVSLGLYAGAREWVMRRLVGSQAPTTERMFEQLYRVAREVELDPQRTPALLTELLQQLFEPIEASVVHYPSSAARVLADGAALLLPVPATGADVAAAPCSIVLRFAHRGRRLFTPDDARLADRVVEQLSRAVAFDRAVEQGRNEERLRLAQDLHDDIGARLLTLMYKSTSPEVEDYVRHTLQDLKTLTRGLAATNQHLSHAGAEWKSDLLQRLAPTGITLVWRFEADEDPLLNVVQWSGLTRVLRELVSNVIAHARARRVEVDLSLRGGVLVLLVQDDGHGADPGAWLPGLGTGGIRKRVRLLGGDVQWRCTSPRGIRCQVVLPGLPPPG